MKIKKTGIPVQSLTNKYLPANYTDTFKCEITDIPNITSEKVQISFWLDKPGWINALFKIRNIIVKPFGLKSDGDNDRKFRECIESGGKYGFASVYDKSENETVLCLDDKHLSAIMSVLISDDETGKKNVYIITLVHFHYWLGYLYFYIICSFHMIIVRSMLKHSLKKISGNS